MFHVFFLWFLPLLSPLLHLKPVELAKFSRRIAGECSPGQSIASMERLHTSTLGE